MSSVAKIAVSLDPELLRRAESLRQSTGETRSALVARALVRLVEQHDEEARVAEYVDAYRRKPEGPAEVNLARDVARRSLTTLAWDE
jgi:predicted transcriptional regulator